MSFLDDLTNVINAYENCCSSQAKKLLKDAIFVILDAIKKEYENDGNYHFDD